MNRLPLLIPALLSAVLSACLIVPVPHTSSNVYQYSGRLRDRHTGQPIVGASVALTGLPATTTHSDAAGRFLTRTSHTLHLFGFYTYDGGADIQLPSPRYATGPLRITDPRYHPVAISVRSDRNEGTFEPDPGPVDLKDIYLEKRSP